MQNARTVVGNFIKIIQYAMELWFPNIIVKQVKRKAGENRKCFEYEIYWRFELKTSHRGVQTLKPEGAKQND